LNNLVSQWTKTRIRISNSILNTNKTIRTRTFRIKTRMMISRTMGLTKTS